MSEQKASQSLPALDDLIRKAFEQARRKGKPEWQTMTLAVLKNRLLQETSGSFAERDYGFASLRELAAGVPHLLRFEGDAVEFIRPEEQLEGDRRKRLRPDLWRAIVDFSSGSKYAFDAAAGIAREAGPSDQLILPTLTRDEMAQWRADFVAEQPVPVPDSLVHWRDQALGTKELPPAFRGPWSGFVRERVRARVEGWFAQKQIAVPAIEMQVAARDGSSSLQKADSLRRLIMTCVAAMTDAELRELRLPPQAVLRALEKEGNS